MGQWQRSDGYGPSGADVQQLHSLRSVSGYPFAGVGCLSFFLSFLCSQLHKAQNRPAVFPRCLAHTCLICPYFMSTNSLFTICISPFCYPLTTYLLFLCSLFVYLRGHCDSGSWNATLLRFCASVIRVDVPFSFFLVFSCDFSSLICVFAVPDPSYRLRFT